MKNLINFILFQLGWFACALGAGGSSPYLGPMVVTGILIFHLGKIEPSLNEFFLIVKIAFIGLAADSFLAFLGAIDFGKNTIAGPLSPPFMVALWVNFAMTLNHSMGWLKRHYVLGLLFGALGGPFAYYAGAQLEALVLSDNFFFALGMIALVWALATPILLFLAKSSTEQILSTKSEPEPLPPHS